MSRRTTILVALSLVVAGGGLSPAAAGHKKPITEKYEVTRVPVPYPVIGTSCTDSALEGVSMLTRTITPTGPGRLEVTLTGFSGDWDITVKNDKGAALGSGGPTTTPTALTQTNGTEKLSLKIKKGMKLNISICNFLGGPKADAKYVFTYA